VTAPTAPRRSTRAVLLLGILSGLSGLVMLPSASPEQLMLASDVYRHATEAMLAGEEFYGVSPPRLPGYTFIYPPIVILVFLPHALVGSAAGAFAIQTVLNVGFGLGTTVIVMRALDRRGITVSRVDWALVAGFVLLSAHSAITLANGQVTIWLGFAVALGLHALDSNREAAAGTAFAAAALVKVFPAAIGLWLLRQRAWRGVAAAIATGLGGLALGALILGPDVTSTYVQDVLLARLEGETYDGVPDPDQSVGGAQRQLAALTGLGHSVLGIAAVLLVAPVLVALYRRADTDPRRQSAVLGTIICVLLAVPLQRLYMPLFAFPLLVLLYTLPSSRARTVLIFGALVSFARVNYELAVTTVEWLALPAVVSEPVLWLLDSFFTVVLPTTLGLWIMLAGCVLVHYGSLPAGDPAGGRR